MLGFLHTLPANVETFGALLQEMAPGVEAKHLVDEEVLALARAEGTLTAGVRRLVAADVSSLVRDGAQVILCTCSTIGPAAETAEVPTGSLVLRTDRPMAERALACGPAILVVATLENTFAATVALLEEVACAQRRSLQVTKLLVREAWAFFERGDLVGYARAVARTVAAFRGYADAIVLAQASMAPAADLLTKLHTPLFSSPRLGLEAALVRYQATPTI